MSKKAYVQIDDPVDLPAPLPAHPHRIERRASRPIAVRVGVESWLHRRLQRHLHDRLGDAIGHGGDAESSRPFPVLLRYLDRPPRRARRGGQLLDPQGAHRPALAPPPARFTLHFTLTYSSWLNLVERWFEELTTKWLRRGTHRSVKELTASIRTWITGWNDNPKPFVWHKTADKILETSPHIVSGSLTQDTRRRRLASGSS